jgi:Skp family chaperone for outer membrane proteins|tara:strand:+ start:32386 stop:33330 length:945 start_codon:yes stop_codon:yes gene_type:complete
MGNTFYFGTTILILARYFLKQQPTIMKTNKLLFLSLILLSFGFTAQAQRGARIGYIDMEYILESVPEYKEASTQLEGKVQRWKKDIEKKTKEVEQMKLNLSNERVLLTNELIEEREEEIKILEDEILDYQQDRFGPNGDLMIQRRQLVQPIQDQVFNIVQEIAENKKYDFIFDKSADVVMLFAAERNDISDIVLRSINRAAKREEAQTKREEKEIERKEELSVEEEGAVTEREQKLEDRKNAREQQMEERQRVRDSIRAARKAEIEARRQRILEERQARIDSIEQAREAIRNERNNQDNDPNEDGDGSNEDGEN